MTTPVADASDRRSDRRTITPRRSLPSGRALVGAFLVTVAALGAFAIATGGDDGPATRYLVTTRDIAAGDQLSVADVTFEAMTLSDDLASRALNSTEGLDGATALRDFRAGELIDVADVVGATAGSEPGETLHEVTFGVPLERTPASLVPGDRVTVLATVGGETRLTVEDAVLLEVDRQPDQIGSSGRGVLTLSVDAPETVMDIAHLTQIAEITIVRSTRAIADVFPTATDAGVESDR
ncbi:MAG: SAF domain-containing protein [Actinomycetota bacterium]